VLVSGRSFQSGVAGRFAACSSGGRLRNHYGDAKPARKEKQMPVTGPAADTEFDLDVTLLEVTDPNVLIYNTDDGCGSTCGACTTGAS
jgi:FxLD family lantipeptide